MVILTLFENKVPLSNFNSCSDSIVTLCSKGSSKVAVYVATMDPDVTDADNIIGITGTHEGQYISINKSSFTV